MAKKKRASKKRPKKSKRSRRKKKQSTWRRRLIGLTVVALMVGLVWLIWPFWQMSGQFAERPVKQPSRLYGEPQLLIVGRTVDPDSLLAELDDLGYRRTQSAQPAWGQYYYQPGRLRAHLRSYPTRWGRHEGGLLDARWSGRRLVELRLRGEGAKQLAIEPPLVYSYYGSDYQERRPAALEEIARDMIQATLAAEDSSFFHHKGLSFKGIARAAWVNLRGGEIRQGGSTLTQQLVKNLFLTQERTFVRKLREVALALMIDMRYDKEQILSAYLNEIYWGASSGANLMGVGAAAWAYFGTDPTHLTLCQSAVLAGMIRSPGNYSPVAKPERSRERRDWVLTRMEELGWLQKSKLDTALAEPLCVSPQPARGRRAPYFGDRMAIEAGQRFGVSQLADAGYVLLSTLDRRDQVAAEASISWGLEALKEGWEKDSKVEGPLQAALVSIDPGTGAIRSYVGGRDYGESQFDRVSQAHRQTGSAFKPVVYATAFENRVAAPSSLVEDEPLTVKLAGRTWSPKNSDEKFRGWVSVRTALEKSLNVPTARLALDVGLPEIVEMARELGITSRLQPVPALALGAFEVTPLELASVYSVFAAGGIKTQVHGLHAVLDSLGQPVEGQPVAEPEQVLSPQANYLLTSVLQGVLDRGTGASARVQGLKDPLAGKTGTTNDRRDSWFAGYSPDRVSLVWVGYDDNSKTRLSGARAALPIWARFTWKVRPAGGYPVFEQPPGISTAVIDPTSGTLATDDCPEVFTEVFLEGTAPREVCRLHGDFALEQQRQERRAGALESKDEKGRWRWLRKLFRKDKSKPPQSPD
jgi:penicillin-binding protein 1B